MSNPDSRRSFLKVVTTTTALSASPISFFSTSTEEQKTKNSDSTKASKQTLRREQAKPSLYDGPSSPLFNMVTISGNEEYYKIPESILSERMVNAVEHAPTGQGTAWGIPFNIARQIILIKDEPVSVHVTPFSAKWLVFLHTSDEMDMEQNKHGFYDTCGSCSIRFGFQRPARR